eukprot:666781-Amorphochlora_amoeboformis.AAC.1
MNRCKHIRPRVPAPVKKPQTRLSLDSEVSLGSETLLGAETLLGSETSLVLLGFKKRLCSYAEYVIC